MSLLQSFNVHQFMHGHFDMSNLCQMHYNLTHPISRSTGQIEVICSKSAEGIRRTTVITESDAVAFLKCIIPIEELAFDDA